MYQHRPFPAKLHKGCAQKNSLIMLPPQLQQNLPRAPRARLLRQEPRPTAPNGTTEEQPLTDSLRHGLLPATAKSRLPVEECCAPLQQGVREVSPYRPDCDGDVRRAGKLPYPPALGGLLAAVEEGGKGDHGCAGFDCIESIAVAS